MLLEEKHDLLTIVLKGSARGWHVVARRGPTPTLERNASASSIISLA